MHITQEGYTQGSDINDTEHLQLAKHTLCDEMPSESFRV